MERDDEIEKISRELEELLSMTSDKGQNQTADKKLVSPKSRQLPIQETVPGFSDEKVEINSKEEDDLGENRLREEKIREDKTREGEALKAEGRIKQEEASKDDSYEEGAYEESTYEDDSHEDDVYDDDSYEDNSYEDFSGLSISFSDDLDFDGPQRSGQAEKSYRTSGIPRRPRTVRYAGVLERDGRPAGQRTKERPSLIKTSDGLAAAFFVPIIIMIIIFAQRGIFPFGEESFLRTDMYHQYAPFFSEFQYKLTHGGSLLYSWDVGMGVNFSALYAYYLASPLNWLLMICPRNYIIEFMTYMIVFKIGLSGLSFAYYLRKHCKTRDFGIAFFGIFYALSGYMAAYSWNIMWLDCIILFPLIALGLERLVHKKKCVLYCITLGLSIISNYYISIMICAFMVIYFIALLILDRRKPWKEYAVNVGHFVVFSLVAGGLAAVVLLPEIYALQITASSDFTFPQTVSSYFSIFDMIARQLPNVETEIGLDHWPNIYSGVAVLLFFLLYLGCRQIQMKKKVVYCSMLLFFFASFSFNILNFMWHGFHYPNSLPCRQSFIYIFLMLTICYEAYIHLNSIPWKHVVLSFFGSVVFVLMAQKLVTDEAYHFSVFYVAILFLAFYAGLIRLWQNRSRRNTVILLTLAVVSIEAAVNTTVTSVTTTSRTNYVRDNEASEALVESLIPNPNFYRVEKVTRKTKNDGAWMNFPSVSLFSSTANADLSKFFKKLGCESSTNAYSITGSTPLVDSLFSVRYALYSDKPKDTGLLTELNQQDDMWLYENAYTLPLGVVVSSDLEDNWQLELSNPAEVQNDLSVIVGASPVMEEVPSEVSGTKFTFTPEKAGDYYVFVSNKKVEKISASIGETSKTFDNVNRGYFVELGYLEAGEEVTLHNDDNEQDLVAMAYRFLPEGLRSVYDTLNRNSLSLTRWESNRLAGTVEAEKAGVLYLSIPYDKGWSVYVDGVKQNTEKLFDTFLSVKITAGTHSVDMKYVPEGLKAGTWITAGSILFLVAAAGAAYKKSKKLPKVRRRREHTDEES